MTTKLAKELFPGDWVWGAAHRDGAMISPMCIVHVELICNTVRITHGLADVFTVTADTVFHLLTPGEVAQSAQRREHGPTPPRPTTQERIDALRALAYDGQCFGQCEFIELLDVVEAVHKGSRAARLLGPVRFGG